VESAHRERPDLAVAFTVDDPAVVALQLQKRSIHAFVVRLGTPARAEAMQIQPGNGFVRFTGEDAAEGEALQQFDLKRLVRSVFQRHVAEEDGEIALPGKAVDQPAAGLVAQHGADHLTGLLLALEAKFLHRFAVAHGPPRPEPGDGAVSGELHPGERHKFPLRARRRRRFGGSGRKQAEFDHAGRFVKQIADRNVRDGLLQQNPNSHRAPPVFLFNIQRKAENGMDSGKNA